MGEWIGEGRYGRRGVEWSATVPVSFPFSFEKPVSFPCHDKGREGRQQTKRIREEDDEDDDRQVNKY